MLSVCIFFFFKQKTAYEMRISDWSSDVCSSDLHAPLCDMLLTQARGRYVAWYEPGYHWIESHLECCLEPLERDAALGMAHAQILASEPAGTLVGHPLGREHEIGRATCREKGC